MLSSIDKGRPSRRLETSHLIELGQNRQTRCRGRAPVPKVRREISPANATFPVKIAGIAAKRTCGSNSELITSPSLSYCPVNERGSKSAPSAVAVRKDPGCGIDIQVLHRSVMWAVHHDPLRSAALPMAFERLVGAAAALGTIFPSRNLVCQALTAWRRLAAVSPG